MDLSEAVRMRNLLNVHNIHNVHNSTLTTMNNSEYNERMPKKDKRRKEVGYKAIGCRIGAGDMELEFLTRNEVAGYLRVHPRTVERWLKSGSLKGHKLGKGRTSLWRIPMSEFLKFLGKQK